MKQTVAATTKPETFVIPSLDGIRALAFLMVFFSHAGLTLIPGGFGVTVFFFLSGYLITTLLRREAESTGGINFKLFYLRRALRILPPFYLVLALAWLCTRVGLSPSRIDLSGLAAQALHYSNYWVIEHTWDGLVAGTGVYWSLAVEEHFYLLFPALYVALLRSKLAPRAQHAVLLAICALVLGWRTWLVLHGAITDRTFVASDCRFDSMLFGCALAIWGNPAIDFPKGQTLNRWELAASIGGLLLLAVSFVVRDPIFRESVRYTIQGIGLYPLFFVLVRHPSLPIARLLNQRWVRFLGTLSYSLYLLHFVALLVVRANIPGPWAVQTGLALGFSVGLSLLIWRYVEKPCAKLRGRLASGVRSPAALQAQSNP